MSVRLPERGADENERARQDLTARVRELVGIDASSSQVMHDWSILDYSSCFSIEWTWSQSRWGVFVKIPKIEIDRKTVLSSREADRVLGRHEYASLTYLERHWNGSEARVDYVKPLAFFEDCNAIVTERTYAGEFLGPFRRAALWRQESDDALLDILRRTGLALRTFHRRAQAAEAFPAEPFEGKRVIQKIERIIENLRSVGVTEPLAPGPLEALREWTAYRSELQPTMTLKGLDVRNMFVDGKGQVSLLDPGRLKKDVPEADLARLLVTIQILYWGTPWFFLRMQPAARYAGALLDGYSDGRVDPAALQLLVVKELFKHWRAAYVALTRKRWPRPLEWVVSRAYIDAFYRAETARAVGSLRASVADRSSAAQV